MILMGSTMRFQLIKFREKARDIIDQGLAVLDRNYLKSIEVLLEAIYTAGGSKEIKGKSHLSIVHGIGSRKEKEQETLGSLMLVSLLQHCPTVSMCMLQARDILERDKAVREKRRSSKESISNKRNYYIQEFILRLE